MLHSPTATTMADALTLDVLVRVAERSVLHPFFAFWIPIFAFAQVRRLARAQHGHARLRAG